MKVHEIKNIINTIERKYNVDEWIIDDIHIWPLIRITNYIKLSYGTVNSKPINSRSFKFIINLLLSKFKYIIYNYKDRLNNNVLQNADVLYLSDGISYTQLNDNWYHKFYDPLASYFNNLNISSIRFDLGYSFLTPRFSKSIFIQTKVDNVIIKSILKNRLFGNSITNVHLNRYNDFCNDQFVIDNFLYIPSQELLKRRVHKIIELKNFFKKYINCIKPKIAFLTTHYSDDHIAYTLACKDLNIPVIDIQHGVQGDLHLAYGSWIKVPINSYITFPNYFWVWTDSEKIAIENWSKDIKNISVIVGGNLFSKLWKHDKSVLVNTYDNFFRLLLSSESSTTILLTISPHTEALMNETWKALKETQYKYNWLIRIHPSMTNTLPNFVKSLKDKGIVKFEAIETSKFPLYSLLRNVNIHITAQSSCVIEAEEFKIFSLITSDYGCELYQKQLTNKSAVYCESYKEIITGIINYSSFSRVNLNDVNNDILPYICNKFLLR